MAKNIFLILLVLLTIKPVIAQEQRKPVKGSRGLELTFNPFDKGFDLNNSLNQVKGRYFISNTTAFRLAFDINHVKDVDGTQYIADLYSVNSKITKKSLSVFLNFGFEKHRKGTKYLSPYYGIDLAVGYQKSNFKGENEWDDYYEIKGTWPVIEDYRIVSLSEEKRGFFRVGTNLVCGVDIYLTKGFYLGYEINYSISYTKYHDVKTEDSRTEEWYTGRQIITNPDYGSKVFSTGVNLMNGIRIGYMF